MHQNAIWYGCRQGLCVRWRPSPLPKKGADPPKFSAHVYCGQTAEGIKMPLGTMVSLSPGDSVLDGDPAPSPQRGGAPSRVFGPFLLWLKGWMHQDATWYGDRPQPTGVCVRWGPCPLPKKGGGVRGRSLQFLAHVSCGQTAAIAACIKMELGTEVSLGPVRIALDGDTAPLPQKGGRAPQFSAHLYCGQMAAWIKMPLGTEVGLSLIHISEPTRLCVRWGPSPLPKKEADPGGGAPNFWPMSLVAKRLQSLHVSRWNLAWT